MIELVFALVWLVCLLAAWNVCLQLRVGQLEESYLFWREQARMWRGWHEPEHDGDWMI